MTADVSPRPRPTTDIERRIIPPVMEDAVMSGLVGAVLMALWFLVFDVVRGMPFFTPSLLGSVLFTGAEPHAVSTVSGAMVFAYSGVHTLVFLGAGFALAVMFRVFAENPQFGMVLLLLFLLFEAIVFGFEAAVFPHLIGEIGTAAVAVGNILAALSMFWLLLYRHPSAWAQLRDEWGE